MPKIVPIVEGDGEVYAVPNLLSRILKEFARYDIHIARPKNAHGKETLLKEGGLERFIKSAWKEPDCGAILVLLDADDDCPKSIAKKLSDRARSLGVAFPVVIVVANHMYEAWFLASIASIAGRLDFLAGLQPPANPEAIRNPKEWINLHFPQGCAYKETEDQEAMTRLIDFSLAKQSRSFRRLLHAIEQALEAIDSNKKIVTPMF